MSLRDAARANWRADLLDYTADALKGSGLSAMADEKRAQAASNREYAVLMGELSNAKAGYAADPSIGPKAILDDVKSRVVAFREAQRTNSREVRTVDNLSEPSDAELQEAGY